jgi:hypothetical protein
MPPIDLSPRERTIIRTALFQARERAHQMADQLPPGKGKAFYRIYASETHALWERFLDSDGGI